MLSDCFKKWVERPQHGPPMETAPKTKPGGGGYEHRRLNVGIRRGASQRSVPHIDAQRMHILRRGTVELAHSIRQAVGGILARRLAAGAQAVDKLFHPGGADRQNLKDATTYRNLN